MARQKGTTTRTAAGLGTISTRITGGKNDGNLELEGAGEGRPRCAPPGRPAACCSEVHRRQAATPFRLPQAFGRRLHTSFDLAAGSDVSTSPTRRRCLGPEKISALP
jgi:hypothetical protein